MAAKNGVFAGTSLQTANIVTRLIEYYTVPAILLTRYNLPRRAGVKALRRNRDARIIRFSGRLIGTSQADLESRIDALNLVLSAQSGTLDIDHNGSTRRFTAQPTAPTITPIAEAPSAADFVLEFICADPYGYDTGTTALTFSGMTLPQTAATGTASLTIGGTVDAEPILTLTVTSTTGSAGGYITLTNTTTNEQLMILRSTWTNGDVIVINWATQTVTVNGTEIDVQGAFPSMPVGTVPFVMADNFTTRSLSLTGLYTKRWL